MICVIYCVGRMNNYVHVWRLNRERDNDDMWIYVACSEYDL